MNENYSLLFKLIKQNNNQNNNNIRDLNRTFFLVWRNQFIRSLLFKYINFYQKYRYKSFRNLIELGQYEFKEYLYKITLKSQVITINQEVVLKEVFKGIDEGYQVFPWIKELEIDSDLPLKSNYIPNTVESLSFELSFNQSLSGAINNNFSLKKLSLGHYFNTEIVSGDLPPSLHTVIFDGCHFGRRLKPHNHPLSITFKGSSYNIPFQKDIFPPSLTHLELSEDYDHPFHVGDLPVNLITLKLGFWYNQPIQENVIPQSCQFINFGCEFDHPLNNNNLPSSLTRLELSSKFSQKITQLPNNIQFLQMGIVWNHSLGYFNFLSLSRKSIFPNSLTHLELSTSFDKDIEINDIPSSVSTLIISSNYKKPVNTSSPSINVIIKSQ